MGYKVPCSLLLSVWQYKWFLALLAQTRSYLPIGLDAWPVAVEVHSGRGLPGLAIVGLPDRAVTEAKERVRSALATSGFALPSKRFIVNLAPADLRKEGGYSARTHHNRQNHQKLKSNSVRPSLNTRTRFTRALIMSFRCSAVAYSQFFSNSRANCFA